MALQTADRLSIRDRSGFRRLGPDPVLALSLHVIQVTFALVCDMMPRKNRMAVGMENGLFLLLAASSTWRNASTVLHIPSVSV